MERDVALRAAMVARLVRGGVLQAGRIAEALQSVPRHRFVPDVPLAEAYDDRAIATKVDGDLILSSISQPGMIAQMLELLDPLPGQRVFEIGTGTGYQAALLAELTGPQGSVTSLELDADLAARATRTLAGLGYRTVRTLAADGARDLGDAATYDRVIVTARGDDLPAAWWDALRDGGRLVAPLQLEGSGEYAIGFVRRGAHLESVGIVPCAFIALRGEVSGACDGDVFYRDPAQRAPKRYERIGRISAVRRADATETLFEMADIVVARPVTLFALEFSRSF